MVINFECSLPLIHLMTWKKILNCLINERNKLKYAVSLLCKRILFTKPANLLLVYVKIYTERMTFGKRSTIYSNYTEKTLPYKMRIKNNPPK